MATLESSIKLQDGVSKVLRSMTNAINIVIQSFNTMQSASSNCVDTGALQGAKREIDNATLALNQMENAMNNVSNANTRLNQSFNKGNQALVNANNSMVQVQQQSANGIGNLTRQVFGFGAAMKAFQYAKESMDMSDVQRRSETQLRTVLANIGASADAYDRLTEKASEIQSYGIYGDEAMIAGAAELATYFTDVEALEKTMETLSNFAMGMSGGGAVDPKQMVQYATQLGKAANGTFGGLSIKGFSFTDEQEKILKGNDDMQKALVLEEVIGASWQDLYDTMSNTPEGRMIQFNNAIGDMREMIGNKLYGALDNVISLALKNLPKIETVLDGVGNAFALVATTISNAATVGVWAASIIIDNWGLIAPIMGTVTGAIFAYKGAMIGLLAYEKVSAALKIANTFATLLLSGATLKQATISTIAANGQWGFNAALLACPITWIIGGIMAFVGALYLAVGVYNQLTDSTISATGIITGAFGAMYAVVYDVFAGIYNIGASVLEFIVNSTTQGTYVIRRLWANLKLNMLDGLIALTEGFDNFATSIANAFIDAINTAIKAWNKLVDILPDKVKTTLGINVGTEIQNTGSILADMYKKRADIEGNIRAEMPDNYVEIPRAEMKSIANTMRDAYDWGAEKSNLGFDLYTNPQTTALNKIAANTGDTAENTGKMKNQMEMNDVELKYMHDIAEREVMNRFTTAEIKVDMTNNNNISSEMDLDKVVSYLAESINESMIVAAEGVHP